jgi:hypothetical protein
LLLPVQRSINYLVYPIYIYIYIYIYIVCVCVEPGSSVSIVSDYGLDDRGSIPDRGRGFLLYPLRPDRLWGPPSLLYNGYRGSFPLG